MKSYIVSIWKRQDETVLELYPNLTSEVIAESFSVRGDFDNLDRQGWVSLIRRILSRRGLESDGVLIQVQRTEGYKRLSSPLFRGWI
jgi:hypothetical protein